MDCFVKKIEIDLFPLVGYAGHGKVGLDEGAALEADLAADIGRGIHELAHDCGQGFDLCDGDKKAGLAGDECFAGACGVGSNDGQGCRGCLEDGDGEAFPERGLDEGVGFGQVRLDIRLKTKELNTRGDAELAGEGFKSGCVGA